jgi:hypothetical protein
MDTIENLVDLAHHASSEKVRLEAQKELLNRVVGKVPDIVVGAQIEQPWENILADTIIPMGETIDLEMDDSGVAHMIPYPQSSPPPSPDTGGSSGGAPPTKVVADGGEDTPVKPRRRTPVARKQAARKKTVKEK